jgi:serine/threonine protein kinase
MSADDRLPSEKDARRLLDAARLVPPGVGESIGPYQLVEEIGRGGHSAVFRAVQVSPVRRELAVKLLTDPAPSANVAARFARERALVARLRHPGIVPLLDAGEVGPAGAAVPWFAMPLVEGESADRWCERTHAPRAVRLRVVELAARAVAAAHALGIVHRDLKPGNIMVAGTTADPQVHVIDFGVAKLLDPEFDAADAFSTRVGGIVGTPEFMSPEQANLDSARVGPATDVYALGLVTCVLLGGVLAGARSGPDRSMRPMGERLRDAADRETPLLSRLAGDRSLRGEIDWIVAKACAREIGDRYPNAGALADDLARLREGQPIVAAPKDSGYAGLYALRRYRMPIAGVAIAVAAALGALAYTVSQESARAEFEAARNERLSALLETARTQLVPLTGRTRGDVVDESKAIPMLEMMRSINLELLGSNADETQQSMLNLARAYDRVDRYADAEPLYRGLLATALLNDRRQGDRAFIRFMLAGNLRRIGPARAAEARELVDQAIAYWKSLPEPPGAICSAILEKSMIAAVQGQFDEQKSLLEEGIACVEARTPDGSQRRREAWTFMGDFLRERGDFAQARAWYERARAGVEDTADPVQRAWVDSCRGELIWMDREIARAAGGALDPALEAEFQSLVAALQKRDPGNPRLKRWNDAAKPSH